MMSVYTACVKQLTCLSMQVNEAAEIIYDLVDPNANLIFGAVVDQSLGQEVSSTLSHSHATLILDPYAFVQSLSFTHLAFSPSVNLSFWPRCIKMRNH